ncbi:MAG: hypothetical protein ACRDJE_16300 [Dehalococcoidia bacterium]
MMDAKRRTEILERDSDAFTALVRKAVRQAIEEHERAGNPISIWRDGKIVEIPPEEIPALLATSYGDDDLGVDAADQSADHPISTPNR